MIGKLRYRVHTFRDAGLEAKWGKHDGTPFIFARKPGTHTWYLVSGEMFGAMQANGVIRGFQMFTCLGSVFSIPAS